MIAMLFAEMLTGSHHEVAWEGSQTSPEFRASVFRDRGFLIHAFDHDFIIIENEGAFQYHRPQEIWGIDGRLVQKLEGWRVARGYFEASYPFVKFDLFEDMDPTGIRGMFMPDGSIRETIGIPFGSGEIVFESEEGFLADPVFGPVSVFKEGRFQFEDLPMRSLGTYKLLENGETRTLAMFEGVANHRRDQVEFYAVTDEVILARRREYLGTERYDAEDLPYRDLNHTASRPLDFYTLEPFGDDVSYSRNYPLVWRNGALEELPRPAETVVNIDGRRTKVTAWWGEVLAPDGRIIGYAVCDDAEPGAQTKTFIAEWSSNGARVLPIPGDIIRMQRSGIASVAHGARGEGFGTFYVPYKDISLSGSYLSADAYGNIALSPFLSVGDSEAFLWDGSRWHNVGSEVGVGFGPYYLHLTSKRGKSFLINRGHRSDARGTWEDHQTCWIVEF